MRRRLLWLFYALLLVAQTTLALPAGSCAPDTADDDDDAKEAEDEDHRESRMHPNLPDAVGQRRGVDGAEKTTEYWRDIGREHVARMEATADSLQRGVARNVILFIGDGMSLTTLAATRVYLGGEQERLAFEQFPGTGLARTYALDRLVPDSACTATAYLGGVKALYGTLGVDGHVRRGDCEATRDAARHVTSIAQLALDKGRSAGLVTTTRVTDASPAAVYAHAADRDWENDVRVEEACGKDSGVEDIALQLMQGAVGAQLKVVMGGGRANLVDASRGGQRGDGRDLIEEFRRQEAGNVFIETTAQLEQVNVSATNRLLGLFNDDHLLYNLEAKAGEQPTLAEMTAKAIEVLATNPSGYFLFVEAGKIDLAHHENKARLALDETAELSRAVQTALDLTDPADTLIVVSADHSHTMTLSGYASRSNDIFGEANQALDDIPYLSLSYANGPSFDRFFDTASNVRRDPISMLDGGIQDKFPSAVPMLSETHDAEDVAVYAMGPWAHLFSGVYEQSTIPHLMAFAACLGSGPKACDRD